MHKNQVNYMHPLPGGAMRTTLDLPLDLIKKAQKLSRAKTKTETIILALKSFVRHQKLDELIALEGKIPLRLNINKARGRLKK